MGGGGGRGFWEEGEVQIKMECSNPGGIHGAIFAGYVPLASQNP